MDEMSGNCKNITCRFITIAVDEYKNQQMKGRIYHQKLKEPVEFGGWIDMMMMVNQICDEINLPRMTVGMRSFTPVKKRHLDWDETLDPCLPCLMSGEHITFRLYLRFRYYASWQGSITWVEGKRTYAFSSFLNLLGLMDTVLSGRELEMLHLDKNCRVCQIAVNSYNGSEMQGDLLQTALNYRKSFKSIGELVLYMSDHRGSDCTEQQSESVKLISGESIGYYRKGGKEATFAVRILYRQHSTLQGMICCRELKKEKPFRSFMEMLYLMASAMDSEPAWGAGNNSADCNNQDHIDIVS